MEGDCGEKEAERKFPIHVNLILIYPAKPAPECTFPGAGIQPDGSDSGRLPRTLSRVHWRDVSFYFLCWS